MKECILDKVIQSLNQAAQNNGDIMVKPEVILWPDPESQWQSIIPILQTKIPELLVFGNYEPLKNQGPAIWLKFQVAQIYSDTNIGQKDIPIIYLPGISKQDLKDLSGAGENITPLIEYQYTGIMWTHPNGKEWTVTAFMQNKEQGLGLNLAQDNATKDAALKVLSKIFEEPEINYPDFINSEYLFQLLFPNEAMSILKWLCKKDEFLKSLEPDNQQIFFNICKSRYEFTPDPRNIKEIGEKFGCRKNNWQKVWDIYSASPSKYPEIEEILRISKPESLGQGALFQIPEDSWPQVNVEKESQLKDSLDSLGELSFKEAISKIKSLAKEHSPRKNWVWAELGKAPLAQSVDYLMQMALITEKPIPSGSIEELKDYYINEGHKADFYARKAFECANSDSSRKTIQSALTRLYKEWLEKTALKFQSLLEKDTSIFTGQKAEAENEIFILFVDAFRYEVAVEFFEILAKKGYKTGLSEVWCSIPSVTPTSKPAISPIASNIKVQSNFNEFRPQTKNEKDIIPAVFQAEMHSCGFEIISDLNQIENGKKYWKEIGNIDKTGHNEQSGLIRRIPELFGQIIEVIETIFSKGISKIKIVTDHGWLLLPGGLPDQKLPKDHTETRWGRCALIKEGIKSELLHLPWRWNPDVLIAYASGISFFRKNEEFAHGGISLQECLTPILIIESVAKSFSFEKDNVQIKWVNLKCNIEITDTSKELEIDIRTKYNDEKTSIIYKKDASIMGIELKDGKATIFIDNEDYQGQAAFIVILDKNGVILFKQQTIIGE